jgi:hypothetical protein
LQRVQVDGATLDREGAEAVNLRGSKGPWLQEVNGPRVVFGDLAAEGQGAGEQAKAQRDLVGMQAVADQVIEVVPVEKFLDGLLHAPALAVGQGQPLRLKRLKVAIRRWSRACPRLRALVAVGRQSPRYTSPRGPMSLTSTTC